MGITDFFVYQANVLALASGTSATTTINIQNDADFWAYKLAIAADVAAAGQTASTRVIPLCTILLTDTGSGRQLASSPVPIANLMGDAGLPFIFPAPKVFTRNATINIQVVNYDAAQTYNLRMSFIGTKVFQ